MNSKTIKIHTRGPSFQHQYEKLIKNASHQILRYSVKTKSENGSNVIIPELNDALNTVIKHLPPKEICKLADITAKYNGMHEFHFNIYTCKEGAVDKETKVNIQAPNLQAARDCLEKNYPRSEGWIHEMI